MDSILVVCYSYTGTSRRAAELLCSHHGWPLGEITEVRQRTPWRCVLDSMFRRRPEIRYQGPAPGDFRTVVLVSPIWAYRLAGPMRTFVARHGAVLGRVAVVSTMSSAGASNAVGEVADLIGRAPIAAVAFRTRDLETGSCTSELLAFGDALRPGSAPRTPMHPAGVAPAA